MMTPVDFHSHILPCVDDGSKSLEQSLEMLSVEREQGVSCVVATPHFYPQHDQMEAFLDRRARAWDTLKRELDQHPELPQVRLGAEVHYFRGISSCDDLRKLTVDGGEYVLIEMPHSSWTEDMYRELERIYIKWDLIPIIAHVDRYLGRFRTYGIPERLSALPVLVQANGEFFLRKRSQAMAIRMVRDEQIHLLGSDCHNLTDRRPNLAETVSLIEKRLGAEALERIAQYQQTVLPTLSCE
ncbi:MAG: hypothetical protein E7437_06195 [Ruminococcaceae bacterium]|nr:hypothetical protein [Oscillospiraceae bacterium]